MRRWCRMTFCLWRRTYSGHLTKRVRSVWGRMSWPGPKLNFRATRETTTRQRTDTKVLRVSLEQRVLLRLGGLARTKGGGGGFLACSGFGFGLVIETKRAMFILFLQEKKRRRSRFGALMPCALTRTRKQRSRSRHGPASRIGFIAPSKSSAENESQLLSMHFYWGTDVRRDAVRDLIHSND